MDKIKLLFQEVIEELHGIVLHELKRVVGLRGDVHPNHVESGPVVAHAGAAGPAEQVEQMGPHLTNPSR